MVDINDALNPKGRFIHSYVKDRLIVRHTVRDIEITFSTKEPIMKVPEIDDILPKEAITLISESGYGLLSMTDGSTNIRCREGRARYFIDVLIEGIESTADTLLHVSKSTDACTKATVLNTTVITHPHWL